MRRLLLALLVVLIGAVAVPLPALARGHGSSHSAHTGSHSGHGGSHHHGHGSGGFHPGFAPGVPIAPAYLYPYPEPIYVEPPPPTCSTTPGYWIRMPSTDATGYTTYYPQWVPDRTVCQ